MKVPRVYSCAAYVPDAVYVFGGVMEADPKVGFTPPKGSVEKFDFTTLRWSEMTSMPTPTLASRCVSLNGKIYVLGGRERSSVDGSANSNVVQVFDPAQNSWSAAARMQIPRAWPGAAVLYGRIYAVGGVRQRLPDMDTGYLDSVERYEPDRGVWTLLDTKLAAPRYMLGVTVQADRIYAIGGQNYEPPKDLGKSRPYSLIEEFDETQGTFRIGGKLPRTIETMEIFPLIAQSLLLADTRHLFRLALHDGTLSEIASLPQHVASHDTALVLTPHGLFAAGGGAVGARTLLPRISTASRLPGEQAIPRIIERMNKQRERVCDDSPSPTRCRTDGFLIVLGLRRPQGAEQCMVASQMLPLGHWQSSKQIAGSGGPAKSLSQVPYHWPGQMMQAWASGHPHVEMQ